MKCDQDYESGSVFNQLYHEYCSELLKINDGACDGLTIIFKKVLKPVLQSLVVNALVNELAK